MEGLKNGTLSKLLILIYAFCLSVQDSEVKRNLKVFEYFMVVLVKGVTQKGTAQNSISSIHRTHHWQAQKSP